MKICKREGPCYVDYTMKNQMHTYIVSNTALALLLLAGYDRYFAYDLGWQPLHMVAAAACTGCNATGGRDCSYLSVVIVRSQPDLKTCRDILRRAKEFLSYLRRGTFFYGRERKATRNEEIVSVFHDCDCHGRDNGGTGVKR